MPDTVSQNPNVCVACSSLLDGMGATNVPQASGGQTVSADQKGNVPAPPPAPTDNPVCHHH